MGVTGHKEACRLHMAVFRFAVAWDESVLYPFKLRVGEILCCVFQPGGGRAGLVICCARHVFVRGAKMRSNSTRLRRGWYATTVALILAVSGCSGVDSTPGQPASSAPPPKLSARTEALPTVTASVNPRDPVAKAIRQGAAAVPEKWADPAPMRGTVSYGDGVSVSVLKVDLAIEEAQGMGTFPGRAYAVFTLKMVNGSASPISLDSVVVTVLDKTNHPVDPVYAQAAQAVDFGGILKPGESAEARYAFAVQTVSRDKVTAVVDFDSTHSSAVFSGRVS